MRYDILSGNLPEEAKGYTRWWWYGNNLSFSDIENELEEMAASHIGGVEIQFVYPLSADNENRKNSFFFSPKFFEKLKFTTEKAKELGMKVDLTLGSGWPFGGPFITSDMAPEVMVPYQFDIKGPTVYSNDFTTMFKGTPVKAVIGRFNDGELESDSLMDITDKLQQKFLHNWPWGYEIKDLEVEEGHWRLFIFIIGKYKQQVGVPSPGMEGHAIDHCRDDVANYYFETVGNPLIEHLGKDSIRSFFCDSIELGGNNWTPALLEAFRKRRGYELGKYMPALWMDIGEITKDIRFDYYQTFAELTLENFFEQFTKYSNKNNISSRVQAHGTWGDILKVYGSADIPEGETFGENDHFEVNTVHRKLASSAAHIYGRPVVSNESFTWLRMPRFLVTLEMMKRAADAIFLDGINHIINHGYSSSPANEEAPGWYFYASSMISHHNTWWPYYSHLSKYIHRVSAFLQAGTNVADVAIYLPQVDIWSEMPMAELHMSMKLEEHIGNEIGTEIQRQGYGFDYINDEALTKIGEITQQGLEIQSNTYKLIILPKATRLLPETALALESFVEKGGKLIFWDSIPEQSSGLLDRENRNTAVKQTMERIIKDYPEHAVVSHGNYKNVINEMTRLINPPIRVKTSENSEGENKSIGIVHRKNDEDTLFFLSNMSEKEVTAQVSFDQGYKYLYVYDPLKGEWVGEETIEGLMEICFEPSQSVFLTLTDRPLDIQLKTTLLPQQVLKKDISNEWVLNVPEKEQKYSLDKITVWNEIEELAYYSGTAYYEKDIELEVLNSKEKLYLILEELHVTAEVFINGESAGVIWKQPYKLDITEFIREGKNHISIKVVNLWINHIINPDLVEKEEEKSVINKEWPYFNDVIVHNRKTRLGNHRETQFIKEPQPSGIRGDVHLVWSTETESFIRSVK